MTDKHIFCGFGLIGENLDIKKNIDLEIDKKGRIISINFDELDKNEKIINSEQPSLLVPGLINSHIHIGDSFAKEYGHNKDIISIVAPPDGLKHKLLSETPKKLVIKGIKYAILEMLSNGITYFADFRENSLEGIKILNDALDDSQIKCSVFGRFNDFNDIEPIFKSADGVGLASYNHLTNEIKNELRKNKKIHKKSVSCHCAEVVRKEQIIQDIFNDNIVDIIIHGTQFTPDDLFLLKKKHINLILCPRSNGYFGVGFPPILDILKLNIPISLGTDNLMVNNTDLFEEIRYLYRITKVIGRNSPLSKIDPKELLKMVTINAAKNLGVETEIGSISREKDADFFVIDLKEPNLWSNVDQDTLYPLIVQRTKPENIKKVFIKGELAYERN